MREHNRQHTGHKIFELCHHNYVITNVKSDSIYDKTQSNHMFRCIFMRLCTNFLIKCINLMTISKKPEKEHVSNSLHSAAILFWIYKNSSNGLLNYQNFTTIVALDQLKCGKIKSWNMCALVFHWFSRFQQCFHQLFVVTFLISFDIAMYDSFFFIIFF